LQLCSALSRLFRPTLAPSEHRYTGGAGRSTVSAGNGGDGGGDTGRDEFGEFGDAIETL
jgi:hypothetical protein